MHSNILEVESSANSCNWLWQFNRFFSVLQHCWFGSERVVTPVKMNWVGQWASTPLLYHCSTALANLFGYQLNRVYL